MRAGALDVAVGKKAFGLRIEELVRRAFVDVALFQLLQEHFLRDSSVVWGSRCRVEVPLQTHLVPLTDELAVVAIDDVLRSDALGIGPHRDRRAVDVGAADHQHLVPHHALMSGKDISRQIGTGEVTKVPRP